MSGGIDPKLAWIAVCIFLAAAAVILLANMNGNDRTTHNLERSLKAKSIVTTFRGDPSTSRAFTWYTEAEVTGVLQLVQGGEEAAFEAGKALTYKAQTSKVDTGASGTQYSHKIEVTGLEPGTEYRYRVGEETGESWSEPAVFKTEGKSEDVFTFLNVTDSQGMNEGDFAAWGNTLDEAFARYPEAAWILHNGDLTEDPEDETAWDDFFGIPSRWLTRIPLMPVTGNHDEIDGEAGRFTAHFNVPDHGAKGANSGTTYSFDYGNAHIVVLNTESDIKEQTEWLREDLESTDKTWLIAAIHRPAYGGNMYKKISDWISVFDDFGVDLVLQGHNHEYARSFPLKGGEIVPQNEGTVYVTTNTSGRKFNDKKEDKFYHAVHFQNGKQMYAGITISKQKLTYQAYDVEGRLLDEFVLEHQAD